jgi:alpha-amylase/alpha-mannosidase (GH57 family)
MRDAGEATVTVVVDGENAWGGYADDGRPFLRALYRQLEHDDELETATFSQCAAGTPAAPAIERLATGSWIDEAGSAPGADLGTWIGEDEENRAWELLADARAELQRAGSDAVDACWALHAAEGSDWFWWFGEDQDSGHDWDFDELFRTHLANVYRFIGREPPDALRRPIVARTVYWSVTRPVSRIRAGDRLTLQTNCPGVVTWRRGELPQHETALSLVGGVMAGVHRYQATLGPFDEGPALSFVFDCRQPGCTCQDACCRPQRRQVDIDALGP